MIEIKTSTELDAMRAAGLVVAKALELMAAAVRPGISTGELDEIAEQTIRDAGAIPSFKGYHGFPATICASVNEQVVHAIPGDTVLREGDIVSIDVGARKNGYYGDAARTFPVGAIDDEARRLLQVTQ